LRTDDGSPESGLIEHGAVKSRCLRAFPAENGAWLSHFKGGDQREVVRRKQGGAGAVDAEACEMKVTVVVKMIKMQDRENSWVGAGLPE